MVITYLYTLLYLLIMVRAYRRTIARIPSACLAYALSLSDIQRDSLSMHGCFLHISGDGIYEINLVIEAVNIMSKHIFR